MQSFSLNAIEAFKIQILMFRTSHQNPSFQLIIQINSKFSSLPSIQFLSLFHGPQVQLKVPGTHYLLHMLSRNYSFIGINKLQVVGAYLFLFHIYYHQLESQNRILNNRYRPWNSLISLAGSGGLVPIKSFKKLIGINQR